MKEISNVYVIRVLSTDLMCTPLTLKDPESCVHIVAKPNANCVWVRGKRLDTMRYA